MVRIFEEGLDYRMAMRYYLPMTTTQNATAEMLTSMGYPVRVTDKCVGMLFVLREGTSLEMARWLAWADGKLTLDSRTDRLDRTGDCPAWLDSVAS